MKKIVDKKGNVLEDKITSKQQTFLYSNIEKNFWKRLFLKILVSKFVTYLASLYFKTFLSKIHISKTIKEYNIDLDLFEKKKFRSYNDFFTRKYKHLSFDRKETTFISPCEGLVSIFPIYHNSVYTIKNVNYHLSDLLKDDKLASEYLDGQLVIFRLKANDYHRYIFIDDGLLGLKTVKIKGKFHTVNPIAFKQFNFLQENTREYNILHTHNFGQVVQIEVGAMMVGKINNHEISKFVKGQEKGFFSFGGSTVVLLIKPNKVAFDQDILNNTRNNAETKINIGETIGHKIEQMLDVI
ncbi:phosphatidylserine decarboxylase [Italian clover phyllody phytoplasma]|uniref:phosphatidylserine decarboxylase n=1 Tax=Italian clover phyllody phytoplasma TaxID=1196420 RepID=UPI0002E68D23|nr:phosphatidylserine decarboxylase [Italian clover phyllody phytoplasma]